MRTPWGPAQERAHIADGIEFVSTSSHGGYKLSPTRNRKVPAYMRSRDGWYEEDVEWSIVVTVFHKLFDAKTREQAKKSLRNWKPDAYEKFYRVKVGPRESYRRAGEHFREKHRNDYIVMTAWGDWKKGVPKGYVGVFAGRGGRKPTGGYPRDTAYFLVPEKEYDKPSPHGFVIDESRHKEIPSIL